MIVLPVALPQLPDLILLTRLARVLFVAATVSPLFVPQLPPLDPPPAPSAPCPVPPLSVASVVPLSAPELDLLPLPLPTTRISLPLFVIPLPPPPPLVQITVHLCPPPAANEDPSPECAAKVAKLDYLHRVRNLIALWTQEFDSAGHDKVDLGLRKKIDEADRAAKEQWK